jgi:FkbM family methyltransferase
LRSAVTYAPRVETRALVKAWGQRVGLDIRQYRPAAGRRARLLSSSDVDGVIDVGASRGQFAIETREYGYSGPMVSFEPVTVVFEQLAAVASNDPLWTVHHVALGDALGELTINVASNQASSSVLPMLQQHRDAAPTVVYESSERVQAATLDSFEIPGERLMVKLDVQGYEDRVLDGATATLSRAALVAVELSLARLYDGQPAFLTMLNRLDELDFEIVDLDPFFYDPTDGRVLSIDAIFARR